MFDQFHQILTAIWQQDFHTLLASDRATIIYLLVATVITLESGFLPAAPLPCDSVVILTGTLTAVGVLQPWLAFPLLIISAATGSWLAFLQGRWLNKLPWVQSWLAKVSERNMNRVDALLCRHGLMALFCARFTPVVRSVLPMIMGIRVRHAPRFHHFSLLSAVLWVCLLAGIGFMLPALPETISHIITMALMAAPVITLCTAMLTALIWRLRRLWWPAPSQKPIE